MLSLKHDLLAALAGELDNLLPGAAAKAAFESPKVASHGDFASTAAMQLAKPLGKNPRQVAETLREALLKTEPFMRWVESIDIAGPGFLNIRLKPEAKQQVIREVLIGGTCFGDQASLGKKMMVEFVSANPTGPLHVGHGRQAALGDTICNLYQTQGWDVYREFYYNDAGVQIGTLTNSTQLRGKGFKPGDAEWPEAAYNGDYIADIAADFIAKKTVAADDRSTTASGDLDDLASIREFAVAYLRREQDLDLLAFSVKFDNYYLESSLYSDGLVDKAVQMLQAAGKTYELDGALWLKSTDYGDDKDRVMRKSAISASVSDAPDQAPQYTYFVPDVAYHITKWQRGFAKAVNIQGTDHHGTIARVRAGLQAANVGIPQGYPDYVLHTMVRVMRGGEEVKISKRAGSYVTLRDLIEWTSKDAVRFFLLSRKPDTEYVFDVDLALAKNNDNPVYYVQYAHARICSVLRQWVEEEAGWPKVREKSYKQIKSLLRKIILEEFVESRACILLQRQLSTLLANSKSSELNEWIDFLGKSKRLLLEIKGNQENKQISASVAASIEELPLADMHVRKHLVKLARTLKSSTISENWGELLEDQLDKQAMPIEVANNIVNKFAVPSLKNVNLTPLQSPQAQALMLQLAKYPEMLTSAALDFAPHDVTFYLRDLASCYHSYYDVERILVPDVLDKTARLALVAATAQVIRNGLAVLGVSAPEKMEK